MSKVSNVVLIGAPFETGFALLRINRHKVVNAALHNKHNIKPVIDTRQLWKNKKYETLFPQRYDVFSYDEKGRVFCSCPSEKRSNHRAVRDLSMHKCICRSNGRLECTSAPHELGLPANPEEDRRSVSKGDVRQRHTVLNAPVAMNANSYPVEKSAISAEWFASH